MGAQRILLYSLRNWVSSLTEHSLSGVFYLECILRTTDVLTAHRGLRGLRKHPKANDQNEANFQVKENQGRLLQSFPSGAGVLRCGNQAVSTQRPQEPLPVTRKLRLKERVCHRAMQLCDTLSPSVTGLRKGSIGRDCSPDSVPDSEWPWTSSLLLTRS